MPKATVEEQEVPVEESLEAIPEIPLEEEVPVPLPKSKPRAKSKAKAKASQVDLKAKHTCGRCGKTMSLHTALYPHKCREVTMPQPPALTKVIVQEPEPEAEPEPQLEPQLEPQFTQAQLLRMQLAQHAQEQRARARLRMVNPIREFYGL